MLHPVHQDDLKIILFYTLIFPFADEGIGAQSCKHEEEFPRREKSRFQDLEGVRLDCVGPTL